MDDITELARQVGQRLLQKNWMLATAESCTGGGIARAITEIAGSSQWFDCGFVTYSNASKTRMLQVNEALIAAHGAVSEEVAAAMARGALFNSGAHVSVSATGIAGPGGAVPGKPVGTVCFAWASNAGGQPAIHSERCLFDGDRQQVREQAFAHALRGLLRLLEQ